ncbi:hypothetical protein PSACC_03218 [Paramicrosporidium saccamoebae]|uniref:Peptidase M14 domain-containing protein n=1 Tax=Paramicrosporidium saccamoebae TaxID=1246581 RepID=A0A2H9TGX9_9FUNG|nr:hypothetical protein PSACC_03218 [Paramicrosporidium saccamoebae]
MLLQYSLVLCAWIFHVANARAPINNKNSELRGHKVVKFSGIEPDILVDLNQLDVDIWSYNSELQEAVAHVDPDQFALFSSMPELNMAVINSDLQTSLNLEGHRFAMQAKRRGSGEDWFSEYHTYAEIKEWYKNLAAKNPETVRFVPSIGKTHQGRDLFAIHINLTPPRPDKKQIWFQGLIHAREWISGSVVQYLSQKLVDCNVSQLKDIEFIIVPVVNPDGYEYTWTTNRLWRKNMAPVLFGKGVDLNRNFDDHWGQGGASKFPVSDTFQGPSAASEPETQAIQNYIKKQHNIVGAIDWHCYSQLILYPYGWTSDEIDNHEQYIELTQKMKKAFGLNGRVYTPEQSSSLYPTSGSLTDWIAGRKMALTNNYRPLSLAVELPPTFTDGPGFVLDPKHIVSVGEESWAAVLVFAEYSIGQQDRAWMIRRLLSTSSLGTNTVLSSEQIDRIRVMLRIDLAGEVAANRIYEGQKLILGKDKRMAELLQHMHDQEKEHLQTLRTLAWQYNARQTLLTPLAHGIAYALGVSTALLGKEAAMACTEAVETVVAEHYNSQIRELLDMEPKDATVNLRAAIRKMRDEELEHKDAAEENGANRSPMHGNELMEHNTIVAICPELGSSCPFISQSSDNGPVFEKVWSSIWCHYAQLESRTWYAIPVANKSIAMTDAKIWCFSLGMAVAGSSFPFMEYLTFLNHIAFMLRGKYPDLLYRLVGINLIPKEPDQQHLVDVSYMNRQLLWQAFTIAVGYGMEVELLRCTTDSTGSPHWSHSVILSQKFAVNCVSWKGSDHLVVLGDSLSVWECVIPRLNAGSQFPGVWICTLAHSLPASIEYAEVSPCENYLATESGNKDECIVRLYKVSFATESLPLKKELGRLLGRSFSQNLEFFGTASRLVYIPLITEEAPTSFSWRPSADDSTHNPALLVTTVSGIEYLYTKDSGPRLDGSDEFILSQIDSCSDSGPQTWWMQNSSVDQLIGEGCAILYSLPRGGGEPCLMQVSGIDFPATTIVVTDRLLNVSCTWEKHPALTPSTFCGFFGNIVIWADLKSTEIRTAQILPADAPFETGHDGVASDYNIESVSSLNPTLPPDPLLLCFSSSAPFGYAICKSKTAGFSFDGPICMRNAVPIMKLLKPSIVNSSIYGLTQNGNVHRLAMADVELIKSSDSGDLIDDIVGEITDDCNRGLPVVRTGSYLVDSTGRKCASTVGAMSRVFGTTAEALIITGTGTSVDLMNWQESGTADLLASLPVNSMPGSINQFGDAVVFVPEVGGTSLIRIYSISPAEVSLLYSSDIDLLVEEPLCHVWHGRDLYIALNDCIVKYSPSLDPHGSEKWRNSGSTFWPAAFPRPLVAPSLSISVSYDKFIWIVLEGSLFRLTPIACEEDYPAFSIPERIVSYRTINYALSDSFDRLESFSGGDSLRNLRKTPCRSQETFSFFEDLASFDLNVDEPVESGSRLQSPTFDDLHDELHSTISRTSLDTTKLSRLRTAVLEATNLLKENEAAVDAAGAKYLFFAKLSWEATEEICTHGFEYLAASMSDAQEILIAKTRELIGDSLSWCKFSHFAMGFWIRNEQRLRELLEDVARTDFSVHRDPAACAILYLILGRRNLLRSLWKAAGVADQEGNRMVSFLSSDFSNERIRSVAAKNAFAALSKQRVRLAIIFFILAGRLEDALQVCFERLEDYHLGFLISRFVGGTESTCYLPFVDESCYQTMLERHVSGNQRIPICIRALMRKVATPEQDLISLLRVSSVLLV